MADQLPHRISCREEDFSAALSLINVLFRHSIFTYGEGKQGEKGGEEGRKRAAS